jgi:hypothetical protein
LFFGICEKEWTGSNKSGPDKKGYVT